jgi:hypothetical protein
MMIPDGSKHVVVFIGFNTKLLYNYKSCAFLVNYYKSVTIQSLQLIKFQCS